MLRDNLGNEGVSIAPIRRISVLRASGGINRQADEPQASPAKFEDPVNLRIQA